MLKRQHSCGVVGFCRADYERHSGMVFVLNDMALDGQAEPLKAWVIGLQCAGASGRVPGLEKVRCEVQNKGVVA